MVDIFNNYVSGQSNVLVGFDVSVPTSLFRSLMSKASGSALSHLLRIFSITSSMAAAHADTGPYNWTSRSAVPTSSQSAYSSALESGHDPIDADMGSSCFMETPIVCCSITNEQLARCPREKSGVTCPWVIRSCPCASTDFTHGLPVHKGLPIGSFCNFPWAASAAKTAHYG